jgi:hypothetical protein
MSPKLLYLMRDKLRLNPLLARLAYVLNNERCRFRGRLVQMKPSSAPTHGTVALCLRFRDEARYLQEWLDYYIAANISYFFLYNNNSTDEYKTVIGPYVDRGVATLIEWPYTPASPAAEEDCIRRASGKYEWVGFIDADEFVVIENGKSIPEFLEEFSGHPGVALHWYFYGSNGHKLSPNIPVLEAYTRRRATPNIHVKMFVRPESVTQCNNSHSWFFRGGKVAVDECFQPIWGSRSERKSAKRAWINHYYTKSEEDYIQKTKLKITLDLSGMQTPSRTAERMQHHLTDNNEVESFSALEYLARRSLLRNRP